MISFIVIGFNEGWKLTKCLQSVFDTIEFNSLEKYEVIYVDSNSTDDSIKRARDFSDLRIYKLTGDVNAAIARNIGAKVANGDVFFFIDGDMEIMPEFLQIVYSGEKGLIENFVSGNWLNYYYNQKGSFFNKKEFKVMRSDAIENVTGGLFLIRKSVWYLIGGMKSNYKRSQDIDLGLRLASKNIFLFRKKEFAAKHHTIAYKDKERMWKDLFKMHHLYGRSFLYRNHIFNKKIYKRIIRNDYSLLILIISIFLFVFSKELGIIFIIVYFSVILIRGKLRISEFFYYFFRDLSVFFGFFAFFPKNKGFSFRRI